ncbi:MAG: methyltransferase domain-containing protein [Deltaproteobacteria bacterium]|nr:methyltransferase domain-containing protein [Deltaproteobacteria bacterium]
MKKLISITLIIAGLALPAVAAEENAPVYRLQVTSKRSLAHVGSNGIGVTSDGVSAARHLLNAIDQNDPALAIKALDIYNKFIPPESFGGEYTALKWFCEYIVATESEKNRLMTDPLSKFYYSFFADNDYAVLKEFINRQFALEKYKDEDPEKAFQHISFLEDLIIFNSPKREKWGKTSKIMNLLNFKKGDRIADIGCGSGYYAYRLSTQVGDEGRVYAIDTAQAHIDFLNSFIKKEGIKNIVTIKSKANDISMQEKVDAAFMSYVYHLIYTVSTEKARKGLINSIKKSLKKGGTLAILDIGPGDGSDPPRPGSYISRELIISQLQDYGFQFKKYHQIGHRGYLLIFKYEDRVPGSPVLTTIETGNSPAYELRIESEKSLIHIGSLDSFDITPGGIQAAQFILDALEKKDPAHAKNALKVYRELIPKENYGGEYTSLQWFCEYLVSLESERKGFFNDRMVEAYFHFFADNDYAVLKEYLKRKYKLKMFKSVDPEVGHTRRSFLEDFILFNNPKREEWEQTSKIMNLLKFNKGDKIADIGCGPGYFTYKFSSLVGDEGLVYAIDIKQEHLDFLDSVIKKEGVKNIVTVRSETNDIIVRDKVDVAFMCSLYHIIYAVSPEKERREFIESIKMSLKPGGSLVIVDNGPVEDTTLPYHGPYIDKELIISQLHHYGFRFEEYHQIIPQRYLLIFRKL